jgi:hypothetical protein
VSRTGRTGSSSSHFREKQTHLLARQPNESHTGSLDPAGRDFSRVRIGRASDGAAQVSSGPISLDRQKETTGGPPAARPKGHIVYEEDASFKKARLSSEAPLFARGYVTGSRTGTEVLQWLQSRAQSVKVHFVATHDDLPDKDPTAEGSYERIGPGEYAIWVVAGFRGWPKQGELTEPIQDRDPDTIAKTLLHELLHVWFETKFPGRGYGRETGHTSKVGSVVEAFGVTTYEKEEEYEEEFLAQLKRFDVELREQVKKERGRGR